MSADAYPDVTPDRKTYCFFREYRHHLRDVPSPEHEPWLAREVFDLEATTRGDRSKYMNYLQMIDAVEFVEWESVYSDNNMATLRRWRTTARGWGLIHASGIHDKDFSPMFAQGNDPMCPEPECDSYGFTNVGDGMLECNACGCENHKSEWRAAADGFGGEWA